MIKVSNYPLKVILVYCINFGEYDKETENS